MGNKQVLRRINQGLSNQEHRQEQAREEVRDIKESILSEQKRNEIEVELPEHDALITRHHLRHARRVQSAGRRLGETVDRLPIHSGSTPYHQRGHRVPKSTEFEAQLLTLIEKYGVEEADEHFSLGQHTKYEKKINSRTGMLEYWNVNTGEREYPVEAPAEKLKHLINQSLREIQ